jgi:hypothetical protein
MQKQCTRPTKGLASPFEAAATAPTSASKMNTWVLFILLELNTRSVGVGPCNNGRQINQNVSGRLQLDRQAS